MHVTRLIKKADKLKGPPLQREVRTEDARATVD